MTDDKASRAECAQGQPAGKKGDRPRPDGHAGQMTGKPLEHYTGIFAGLDPVEIARRTRAAYDAERREFSLVLMGSRVTVRWPGGEMEMDAGSCGISGHREYPDAYERILLLRYLCEGRYVEPTGRYIAYNEVPWGDVYGSNYQGRVLARFAGTFGRDPDALRRTMEAAPGLEAVPEAIGDLSYRFLFMHGLPMQVILWEGDDEFPPSAQLLYDETVVFGFTAEDVAVAGDILIARLKKLRARLSD
jgi:hypothetical protein